MQLPDFLCGAYRSRTDDLLTATNQIHSFDSSVSRQQQKGIFSNTIGSNMIAQ